MRSLNVRYFSVEYHEFTTSHRHRWYCIVHSHSWSSVSNGPRFFGHFSLSRRIEIFYSSVHPFILSSIRYWSTHPLERPSTPALKPSPPRPSLPITPPSRTSRWIDTSNGGSRRREKIVKSCWSWWGLLLPLLRLPLTPPPQVAWAVVWVVVVNRKIAVAISNSFYAVFCLIVSHIPNFIHIGQKT